MDVFVDTSIVSNAYFYNFNLYSLQLHYISLNNFVVLAKSHIYDGSRTPYYSHRHRFVEKRKKPTKQGNCVEYQIFLHTIKFLEHIANIASVTINRAIFVRACRIT